ncbi:hypothetical protein ACMHYB_25615 [Sorangium sp. So ce1128]
MRDPGGGARRGVAIERLTPLSVRRGLKTAAAAPHSAPPSCAAARLWRVHPDELGGH